MGIRNQAVKGGFIMVIRQGLGILLSLASVIFITRVIGPEQYGFFGAASGIATFLYRLGPWGLDVYLVRKTENPEQQEYNQAFTILLAVSTVFALSMILGRDIISNILRIEQVSPLLFVLAFTIPPFLLKVPATAKLERDLNFQRIAFNELISQISYYIVAIPMAFQGAGAWAPVTGLLVQNYILFILSHTGAKLKFGFSWNPKLAKEMIGFGFTFSASSWTWELRTLVNPVIVGRFAGAEAVAFVALAIRLVEMLSFVRHIAWRLAIAALAKFKENKPRLRSSVEEGMHLLALSVGLPMAGFSLVGPIILNIVFGQNWNPVLEVYPFIAVSYIAYSVLNLHTSVLYLLGKNMRVTWFNLVHVILFIGAAFLLVPKMGMIGYGWAEICTLSSYIILHLYVSKAIGMPNYTTAFIWFTLSISVLIIGTLESPLRYFSVFLLLLPLISTKERKNLWGYYQILRS
ncbi:membrane protein involved in the export of O-antigen and teichoic acid [Rivularia sp. PCC 7116]|uniref:oligosaccharide flippase family protein n=1 Tax=Rivularia sp. PCC 7116 TaxID=373994 RepID=UPI00029EF21B|nr:oligosaccharide flippase family protein [Rivularia sp. PCC 7116]AFY58049.1 membrane protein involved in the export of O-antigen and teichoic acid [Rivularia sp. PCC 7116]